MSRNSKARRRTPTTSRGQESRVLGGARWLSSCRRSSRTWVREGGLVPCWQTANPARPLAQTCAGAGTGRAPDHCDEILRVGSGGLAVAAGHRGARRGVPDPLRGDRRPDRFPVGTDGRTRVRLTMEKNRKYTVWLTDQGGHAFMGKPDEPESRWRVYGEYVGNEPGVGLWLHVE